MRRDEHATVAASGRRRASRWWTRARQRLTGADRRGGARTWYQGRVGTWSTAIFGDDYAADVRQQYLALLAEGVEADEASRRMIEEHVGEEPDPDEEPVFWLALAATSWEYGRLQPEVRARALEVIASPGTLEPWGEAQRGRRKAVLAALEKKLRSPQPRPKRPRARQPVEVPSREVPGPDGLTCATAFEIGELGQVAIEIEHGGQRGGGGVFAAACRHDQIGLRWLDADTLEISYPSGVEPQKRDASTYFYGRTIRCVYRT